MSSSILEVSGLEKHFGGVYVTCNIDFSMQEGEQSAIIGPNGAGKSTFMNLLTGYHRPDAGRVVFAGKDITGMPPHRVVRCGISRAFQVSSIFGRMTVGDNVRAAVQAQMRVTFRLFASARSLGAEETERVLTLCGLQAKRDLMAGELAQGDKKRLELAIALAGRPRLLFLDEPTAGMSIEEARSTMELVDRLNRELKLTVLFTEHDMGIVFNHARRLTLLHRGAIVVQGTPEEVRANETAQKVYLGEHHL
ncbi:MAG: ABC transporter ATP-binding protein [Betaproteobacteria bacterium]|nr:MAG: ABC transporter ATP-binding protein [Betaproteobacteria bacterium]